MEKEFKRVSERALMCLMEASRDQGIATNERVLSFFTDYSMEQAGIEEIEHKIALMKNNYQRLEDDVLRVINRRPDLYASVYDLCFIQKEKQNIKTAIGKEDLLSGRRVLLRLLDNDDMADAKQLGEI